MAYYEAHVAILPVRLSYPSPPPPQVTLQDVLNSVGDVCKQIQHGKPKDTQGLLIGPVCLFEQVMLTQDTIHLQ